MPVDRRRQAEQFLQQPVDGCRVKQIVAPHDMGDALQGVTHVVRGHDLFHATAVHRLLQELLGLPAPVYRHHTLIADADGRKLSKSRRDTGIRALREAGVSPEEVREMAEE